MSQHQPVSKRPADKSVLGFILLILGVIFLLKQLGILSLFHIHSFWPVILIAIGIYIGIRNKFSSNAPFILIAIGVFNLIPSFSFEVGNETVHSRTLAIPFFLMLIGLYIILQGRKKHPYQFREGEFASEPSIRADILFGGRKEIVTSKEFTGGRVTTTFGGCEINLLQADSVQEEMLLDLRVTFGGAVVIVPAHWEVRNLIQPILGSVEDKRMLRTPDAGQQRRILILDGSCFCSGIEIKSY